ncbi:terminase large (ATPase) subunit and inactivated derivatives [Noviherbaspirillum humi]|uniref:Terminase large (ATPase) subunit and inactivated derivatives n=2 Tax=Noviherbaspirillum humi TaxID=1688639 RepID=A0A239LVN9_9BURK|nr:terminase large (ATPase) subunit and inactivated derivatives [Noviherbaspirillum humi]
MLALQEKARRKAGRKLFEYFPETGPLRRELYRQHLEFFRLGKDHPTRCFMAANRVGKTEGGGGYETVLHLTGLYPDWWDGRRFDAPIDAWAAGDTNETVRDIIQTKLLGPKEELGTGLIPRECIGEVKYRPNSNGSADYITVKHVSGGWSRLALKSYEQGRVSFQGTEKDLVWLDEESNEGIRAECVMRLMTTGGLLIETFTPLKGLTPLVLGYIGESGIDGDERVKTNGDKAFVMAGWDDVPHLSTETKARMMAECEPHLRDARSKGIPSLGAGAIYPVPEADIVIDDFPIPDHWPRAYGLDVGWNRTAGVWGAQNPDTKVWYLFSEHYVGQAEPVIHASAIKSRGDWIPGTIDPAARGRGQRDGHQLLQDYQDLGLDLTMADNGVESGLYTVWTGLSSGQIKVFKSLRNWLAEYRIYRRDEKGHIVKKNDHLMDATRYLIVTGPEIAKVKPAKKVQPLGQFYGATGWMGN